MGQALDTFRKSLEGDESKRVSKEQLDFLKKAAESKMELYKHEINEMFSNPASVEKIQVAGNHFIQSERRFTINVGNSPDEVIIDAIDNLFGKKGVKDSENAKDSSVADGFKLIVKSSLNFILGNVSIGEQEYSKYFIFFQNNAIIRVDVRIWRYDFSFNGIIGEINNAFCYVFCKSVVDHTKLTINELIYFLSDQAGDDIGAVEAYIEKIKSIYNKVTQINLKDAVKSIPSGEKIFF
ncbi:unnamed protein product [Rhizophagus irregularis]|uniref:Uncharacterized protein n=1 Tax=Rhizophagus irregularis TaxID=588596 RepID=A0A2N1N111_9GLOM|nr:hypothetical protein RhiirC2_783372 [Rhizophagus irregularis]CAB4392582.1 unnamed protein product [Rhizophagus irregularis]CAB5355555.1 unnamed protein product [Rhizophagus irregularis]